MHNVDTYTRAQARARICHVDSPGPQRWGNFDGRMKDRAMQTRFALCRVVWSENFECVLTNASERLRAYLSVAFLVSPLQNIAPVTDRVQLAIPASAD